MSLQDLLILVCFFVPLTIVIDFYKYNSLRLLNGKVFEVRSLFSKTKNISLSNVVLMGEFGKRKIKINSLKTIKLESKIEEYDDFINYCNQHGIGVKTKSKWR